MTTQDVPLVPAGKLHLQGINRRKDIRELLAAGRTNYQICDELGIGLTALRKHLKIIGDEDRAREGAA
jgi:DNA-binding NarL/FixJ family response regulator